MIYIAHRALFQGPNPELENHPDQIEDALEAGFNCEIDVRLIRGRWMLGHDEPTYEVDDLFLCKPKLWIHCKNLEALIGIELIKRDHSPNYFWHQSDDFTLTSHKYIWTYPGKPVNRRRGILVQPEWEDGWFDEVHKIKGAGVCSKFVEDIREFLTNGAL